jgi:hypothetical protein
MEGALKQGRNQRKGVIEICFDVAQISDDYYLLWSPCSLVAESFQRFGGTPYLNLHESREYF